MTVARISQAAVISVTSGADPRISQAAVISIQAPPVANARITQALVVAIMANNRPVISLGNPIALECWNPCASYGTSAHIFFIGGKANG